MAAEDLLKDLLLGHRVALERYSVQLVQDMLQILDRSAADARTRLEALGERASPSSRARAEELAESLRGLSESTRTALDERLSGDLRSLAEYEAGVARAMQEGVRVGFNLILPTTDKLAAIVTEGAFQGRVMRDWSARLEQGVRDRVEQEVRIGMVQGEGIRGIVQRIFGSGGVQGRTRRDVERIVRTAVAHVHAKSHEEVAKRNPTLFDRVTWVASLDNRTCIVCAGLHGRVWRADDAERPSPPEHWNCRCSVLFLAKGEEADVPDFDEWAARQDDKTLRDLFGATRARLFREGRLKTRDMLDFKTLRPLTLEQLRAKDVSLFEAKGVPTRLLPGATKSTSANPLGPIAEAAKPVVIDGSRFWGGAFRELLGVAPGGDYVYHATSQEAATRIAGDRLNRSTPGRGRRWADGTDEKRNFWSENGTSAWTWVDKRSPALIRVRRSDVELFENTAEGGFFSRSSVSAKKLEFLGADGRWHPMTELEGQRPITPTTPPPVVAPPPRSVIETPAPPPPPPPPPAPADDGGVVLAPTLSKNWDEMYRQNKIRLDADFGWIHSTERDLVRISFADAPKRIKDVIKRSEPLTELKIDRRAYQLASTLPGGSEMAKAPGVLSDRTSVIAMKSFSNPEASRFVYRHEYGHHIDSVAGALVPLKSRVGGQTYASATRTGINAIAEDRAALVGQMPKPLLPSDMLPSARGYAQRRFGDELAAVRSPAEAELVYLRAARNIVDEERIGVSGEDILAFLGLDTPAGVSASINRGSSPASKVMTFVDMIRSRKIPTAMIDDVIFAESGARMGERGWSAVSILDFVGAVTNEAIGRGHGRRYYEGRPNFSGNPAVHVSDKNTAEAFANYFSVVGHESPYARVSRWVMRTVAPRTTSYYESMFDAVINRGEIK